MKKKVLLITADDFEDIEVLYPIYRVKEEGFDVLVATPNKSPAVGKHGYKVEADLSFAETREEDFDALIIPGGRAPERVRMKKEILEVVRDFFKKAKPVGAICHGPQVLISANVLKGRRLTGYWSIKDDIEFAGGIYEDKEVVVDGNLISSRFPGDLPYFMSEFIKSLKK
jgi:intracellular protease, PfpI family